MYITEVLSTSKKGKVYRSILLRESYREQGRVKNRTLANLSKCPAQEIEAIKFALKHQQNLPHLVELRDPDSVQLQEGPSVGAVWTVYQVAQRLGIERALGTDFQGKLALWQVIARILEQGSRLSAVRLAKTHAACEVLRFERGFDENDLYENLRWLATHQARVEQSLFVARRGACQPELFFYDVTSSYLEGEHNQLAAYGYNRDKKRGKKQIVVGLLCDEQGDPISVEVFPGNTQDPSTVDSQIDKMMNQLGCQRITFVGDRGMLKSGQLQSLSAVDFHYITAISKPQIQTLFNEGVLRMDQFGETVCEVSRQEGADWVRYILRRNGQRAQELASTRRRKQEHLEQLVQQQNLYLQEHPRAQVSTALRKLSARLEQLKVHSWLNLEVEARTLRLRVDSERLHKKARWDGCYAIKTDLPSEVADAELLHARYQDLSAVEWAFRTCKSSHLELRPVYVQTSESTRGHVLVVMLAYLVIRSLRGSWRGLDVTVEEGLSQLSTLCSLEMRVGDHPVCIRLAQPRETSQQLLSALGLELPSSLARSEVAVVTRKKLSDTRKTQ